MVQHRLDVQTLFNRRISATLSMYGTLLAALSFAGALCEEQKYGVRRYLVFKEGKIRYACGKALAAIMASGISFLLASVLLLVFLVWKYPLWSEVGLSSLEADTEHYLEVSGIALQFLLKTFGEYAYLLLTLAGGCLYSIFCGCIGFLCTAFFSNVYLAVCIPFFFGYMYYSIMDSIGGRALEGAISWETYGILISYISPTGYIDFWRMTESRTVNMLVLLAVWVAAVGVHILRMHKAADCGVNA